MEYSINLPFVTPDDDEDEFFLPLGSTKDGRDGVNNDAVRYLVKTCLPSAAALDAILRNCRMATIRVLDRMSVYDHIITLCCYTKYIIL